MQINGGKVSYSRTIQPAPYESKKADVELSFLLDEGEDIGDALTEVTDICKAHIAETLGLRRKDG